MSVLIVVNITNEQPCIDAKGVNNIQLEMTSYLNIDEALSMPAHRIMNI